MAGRQGRFFVSGQHRLRRKLRRMPPEITAGVGGAIMESAREIEEVMRFNWVMDRPPRLTTEAQIDLADNIGVKAPRRKSAHRVVESAEIGFGSKFGVRHWLKRQGFVARFLERGAQQFTRFPRSGVRFIEKTRGEVLPMAIRRIDRAVDRALQKFIERT